MTTQPTTSETVSSPVGPVPAVRECPYCRKPLKTTSITVAGRVYADLPCWGSCGCEGAKRRSATRRAPSKSELYARAGIGPEYQGARVDCAEQVKAVREGRNVFITGDNGNGKSMLAAAVAMRLIDGGVAALFVNAAIQSQLIRNGFDRGGGGLWERMCEAPALVIDDLGKGKPTEWDCSMWYTVAEARNAAMLPTVTTSNYDGGELIERLTVEGDDSTARAIVSRLRGGAVTVKTSGRDLRLSGVASPDGTQSRDVQPGPRRRLHRCPDCGGMMKLDEATGYVSDCPWCGCSMAFSSDLAACDGAEA